jgi:hypothetical protein
MQSVNDIVLCLKPKAFQPSTANVPMVGGLLAPGLGVQGYVRSRRRRQPRPPRGNPEASSGLTRLDQRAASFGI